MVKCIELWLLEKIIPYAKSPRTHLEAQIAQVAASIAVRFRPKILISRLAASQADGWLWL